MAGTEKLLLAGMFEFRRGEHAAAKKLWEQASLAQPDSPLAWKAAAEAEGFGPFVRGMEVHQKLLVPEIDGCFVDSHELGRCYGTAMALLSLADLEKDVFQLRKRK